MIIIFINHIIILYVPILNNYKKDICCCQIIKPTDLFWCKILYIVISNILCLSFLICKMKIIYLHHFFVRGIKLVCYKCSPGRKLTKELSPFLLYPFCYPYTVIDKTSKCSFFIRNNIYKLCCTNGKSYTEKRIWRLGKTNIKIIHS